VTLVDETRRRKRSQEAGRGPTNVYYVVIYYVYYALHLFMIKIKENESPDNALVIYFTFSDPFDSLIDESCRLLISIFTL